MSLLWNLGIFFLIMGEPPMNHAKRPDLSRPMITMDGPSSPSREQRSAQRIAQDAGNAFCAGDADCNVDACYFACMEQDGNCNKAAPCTQVLLIHRVVTGRGRICLPGRAVCRQPTAFGQSWMRCSSTCKNAHVIDGIVFFLLPATVPHRGICR